MYRNDKANFIKKRYVEDPYYQNGSITDRSREDRKIGLSIKANKDLPQSSVTLRQDPYSNLISSSERYQIINSLNRKVGGNYAGEANLDGGNIQQYASSVNSRFLYCYDFMRLKLVQKYKYLPVTESPDEIGYSLIDEVRKTLSEALSLLGATTYHNLQFNTYCVETDMALGSGETEVIQEKNVYTDQSDVFYAVSMMYQIIWQELADMFTWHNSFRLKQGTMIKSAYNREVPQLNSLFGLFNKKSFLNLLEGISLQFGGEYIDLDNIRQSNMITAMPSRRSNAMVDPVLEIQTRYEVPTSFKMHVLSSGRDTIINSVFDLSEMTATLDGKNYTLFTAIDAFKDLLAAENIMAWARNSSPTTASAQAYFNKAVNLISQINTWLVYIKTKFIDFREALDVLNRTGTVRWRKGYKPEITQNTTAELFHNLLTEDIFRLALSGATSVSFDNVTKRWRTFALWDEFTGIPSFDARQGGSFLTLSFKNFEISADDDNNLKYLPIAFVSSGDYYKLYITNRLGYQAEISAVEAEMYTDRILGRLTPLTSQAGLKLRLPKIPTSHVNASGALTNVEKSMILYQVMKVFKTAQDETENHVDSEIVSIYQIEIPDFTNEAIKFARLSAPITSSTNESSWLGFFGSVTKE